MKEEIKEIMEQLQDTSDKFNKFYKDFLDYTELNCESWKFYDDTTGNEISFYDILKKFYIQTKSGLCLTSYPNSKYLSTLIKAFSTLPDKMQKIKDELNLRDQHAQIRRDYIDQFKLKLYNHIAELVNSNESLIKKNNEYKEQIEKLQNYNYELKSEYDTAYYKGQNDILKEMAKKKTKKNDKTNPFTKDE